MSESVSNPSGKSSRSSVLLDIDMKRRILNGIKPALKEDTKDLIMGWLSSRKREVSDRAPRTEFCIRISCDLVRQACDMQSENGVALLLNTVLAQNHQSPTARPMKVSEIVRDVVGCPKCLEMFLEVHIARLKECLQIAYDQWKADGEPDLGEYPVEQVMGNRDYLMFAYLKMAECFRSNDGTERRQPEGEIERK